MTKNLMRCTACGTRGEAKCKCGEPYIHIPAHQAASLGIVAHPGWSDRRIAEAVGVDHKTIIAARRSVGENSPTDKPKRVGKDGKKYKATKMTKPRKPKKSKTDIPPRARDQSFTPQEEWEMSLIQLATFAESGRVHNGRVREIKGLTIVKL